MKHYQSNINQSTQKRGDIRNKMERPTSKKSKKPSKKANHKGNIKFLNPLHPWEAYQIKKREELLKGRPKKPSPTTTTHLEIETTYAHYRTTYTLWLQNAHKTERQGILVHFTPHTMLAHRWKNPCAYLCRNPKTFIAWGRNMSARN